MATKGKRETTLTPKLRFPEFEEPWDEVALSDLAVPISDRVGASECVPYTVTSGVGLVSQDEKFGRTIAGNSLSNYIRLRKDDFAYNKSATKAFPEGYIARYRDDAKAAVPNSIFACFRADPVKIDPAYLDFLFAGNLHGRWLRKFLTVGARAHGSLNVNNDDLMAMPVPRPSPEEQRKIVACLTSLGEVLAAEEQKLETLLAHKRGLMQHLFPREGESRPRLRFPEFRDAGEWEGATVGSKCKSFSGGTPETTRKEFYGGSIPFIRSAEIASDCTEMFLTEEGLKNSAAKMVAVGDVLVALYGANSGDVALARVDGAINQAILCLRPAGDSAFLYHYLTARKAFILARYIQGGQGNLSGEIVKSVELSFPSGREQQRIAACLSSLDALIAAASRKRDGLRAHKKGLMQQFFPPLEAVS